MIIVASVILIFFDVIFRLSTLVIFSSKEIIAWRK
jgi:hypothetical protein